jgi:hypothetical protein
MKCNLFPTVICRNSVDIGLAVCRLLRTLIALGVKS